ncbi:hypothetical protein DRN76_04385 [Methanosarcinales archaeon]|nr:MAG: hypothetical protein DRN76_04385 [Methanosarcinales archaeon]
MVRVSSSKHILFMENGLFKQYITDYKTAKYQHGKRNSPPPCHDENAEFRIFILTYQKIKKAIRRGHL